MENNRCPFEKAILSTQFMCEKATHHYIGERTAVVCQSADARHDCVRLLLLLREGSRFALKVTDTARELPFGKEMKIVFGGLAGLKALLQEGGVGATDSIRGLVEEAKQFYGTLEKLPCHQVVRYIAASKPGRRGPRT
ncbi:MAG: hypothetical protein M0Z84_12220 [Gammaproteobacteria bacterium]|nr:hypothetical protein [Gammaproteobacteria bacterium]